MDYKDILIASTDCGAVAFAKFLLEHRKFDDNVIANFVEGKDSAYYFSKVEKHSNYSCDKIIFYSCGGRVQLEFAKDLIERTINIPKNIKILYFADSDYGLYQNFDNVYYTDFYSVENFYCQRKCLEQILNKVFNINSYSSDFSICMTQYDIAFEKYRSEAKKLNAYCYCIRKKEKDLNSSVRVDFKSLKFRKLVLNVDLENFAMVDLNFQYLVSLFPLAPKISEDEYNSVIELIDDKMYRGKWELEFFCWFLNEIKKCIKKGKLNLEKNDKVKIDFENQPLILLNDYSIDTSKLVEYISSRV